MKIVWTLVVLVVLGYVGSSCSVVDLSHRHVRLTVERGDRVVPVAAGIGALPGGGWSSLHTHDGTGVIHVEPVPGDYGPFTLGRFFTAWGESLEGAVVYLNGVQVADGPSVPLSNGDKIVVILRAGS